ncbi:MAG: transglycosylase domain-containing protein, partial [Rhizomicrobium sp.]
MNDTPDRPRPHFPENVDALLRRIRATRDDGPANGGPNDPSPPRRRRSRIWLYLGLTGGCLLATVVLIVAFYVAWISRGLPSVDELRTYTPPITTRVYAGDGTVLGEYARERRVFVPIDFVPPLVVQAFISAEDRNFFNHRGLDFFGIARAAIKDVGKVAAGRRPEGASTITQQVARNFLLNSDVKMARKVREAILAVHI